MEYSSLTDFDSKLSALKDPNCPGEIIDKIVMADDFPWGSEKAEMAKDLIASHSNTLPKQLENLFKNAANEHQKALILKNPNCPEKLKPTLDEIEIEEKKEDNLMDDVFQYKITPENSKSITRTIYYINTDTEESFEVQEVYRDGYFILELKERLAGHFPFMAKNGEIKVSNYKIIDHKLNDVTYSDADTDMIDELEDKGILDEKSRYYINGPIEIIKINS